ncbi:LytR/AlgR family response regulator transcription factor [Desulfovibrio inopinatus]|uniref:LytR/AlgR family response regulator transcription factor n=1 Tax=Desulfovibrio inopinatus TaxID=102109 RepID=UPI000420CA94|nr:LytTR family DNA-binding domain-containing protein [Desulfovibrio inopinatus]
MASPIRTIIVDDELPAQDELRYLLTPHNDIEIIETADNAADAVELIHTHEPDLVFLDIQMPGESGLFVPQAVMDMEDPPLIIFVTAFDEHAIRAFEENAMDYILKPVGKDRLAASLERVRQRMKPDESGQSGETLRKLLAGVGIKPGITRISAEHSGRNILLNPREIIFFTYENRRVYAVTFDNRYACPSDLTLDRLEERLDAFPFFRANRSQLVNLAHVRSYAPWFNGKYILTMNDQTETDVTVNKARVRDFRDAIEL